MNTPAARGLILVTGATGKVGRAFIERLLADARYGGFRLRALCHKRTLPPHSRVESVRGSIQHRDDVRRALEGATHVVHLATSKETPDDVMDVAVKGMFWLLEECRASSTFRQFLLVGGDAAVGHFYYPHAVPVVESQPHSAYPGCYALSKVLEEVMLEQYQIQYGLNGCCLRAPWIMEKDDFRYTLSFGDDVFGGPRWHELVEEAKAREYAASEAVPVMLDPQGKPVKRNFVPTPYHSTWLDNSKAKFLLGWRPRYDMARLVEAAWTYQRSAEEPRVVWYPG
jgi:UDP-glucose 4-epimerase